jgi:hypothetical protein
MIFLRILFNGLKKLNESLLSFIKILLFSKIRVRIKKLKSISSSNCYILGNGPSLVKNLRENIDFLKSQKLFVVNNFVTSEYYEVVKPTYYVLADPAYWDQDAYEEDRKASFLTLNRINDLTTWSMYLIVPNEAFKSKIFKNVFVENKNIEILNYNTTSIIGFNFLNRFFYKNYLGMPPLQNVLCACIFFAINMNFIEINLLGADHSWTKDLIVNNKNEVCQAQIHFYTQSVKKEFNIFIRSYGEPYKMHQILRDYAQMFETYHLLEKYANYKNVRIYNRSEGSFIDAFERKSIYND